MASRAWFTHQVWGKVGKPNPFGTGPENVALHRTIEHSRHIHAVMRNAAMKAEVFQCPKGAAPPAGFRLWVPPDPEAGRGAAPEAGDDTRPSARGSPIRSVSRSASTSPRSTGHHRLDGATPNSAATLRQSAVDCIAFTTRFRRSLEYGFVIHTGPRHQSES